MDIFLQILYTILIFGFLIFVHEFGHFITAKLFKIKVNEFAIGMGPAVFKKQKKETTYALRIFPIGGYVSMEGEDEDSKDPAAFNNKPAWQRFIVVAAGAFMNVIFGLIFTLVIVCNAQLKTCTVSGFYDGATSFNYGIEVGDEIVKIDNSNIDTFADIQSALSMTYGKDAIDVTVIRNGEKIILKDVVFPKTSVEDMQISICDFDLMDEEKNVGTVLSHTFKTAVSYAKTTATTLVDLIQGKLSVKYISGPVGTSEVVIQAAKAGFLMVIYLMALLSINLAVVNLLPLPALDGGRLLFIFIEMIFRKPVPKKAEGIIHFIGIIILFAFMIFIAFKDIIFMIR